jgi:hypothetical protein
MDSDDHNVVALRPIHNPQHSATGFLDRSEGTRQRLIIWIGVAEIGLQDSFFDPLHLESSLLDGFFGMLGEPDELTAGITRLPFRRSLRGGRVGR